MGTEGARKRDRSNDNIEEEWQTDRKMVEELREDLRKSKRYDMGNLTKMRKQCTHYHKQRVNNIDGRQGGGLLGTWQHLKEELSHLNIIYAAMLYVIDDEMWDVWASTLEGREARSINGMIGLELARIMNIANTYKNDTDRP